MKRKLSKLSKWIISIVVIMVLSGIVLLYIEIKNETLEVLLAGSISVSTCIAIAIFTNNNRGK